ncbi:MAG: tetratricopeptide repeat protein [Thermodesulfobacteriota bacterium]
MNPKKELLADVLFNLNLINLLKRLPLRNKLIVLNYHRVRPVDPPFATEFEDGVYTLNADQFNLQIKWLKHNTLILSENELIDCYRDGIFFPPKTSAPCVMITFDDGYRDNYTIAYPILKHYDVPAILFVTTQMVNTRQVPWWDVIAYLIKRCAKPFITYDNQPFPMGDSKADAIAHFQLLMKKEQYEHTKYLIQDLSDACEVPLPDAQLQDREILTWEQIQEMAQGQIAFGSHTHTHRVLSTINASSQKEEMILSKLIIEKNIGQPVLSICYPCGEPQYITEETAEIAASSGYMLGFTANTGVNYWKSIERFTIRRTASLLQKVSTVSLLTILPEVFTWGTLASFQLKTMEAHPRYADVYYRLGIIYLGQEKIEQAIKSFMEALRFNPGYTEARIKLGISQAFDGQYDEAEKNLLLIIEKKPSFADVYFYLGIVYAGKKQIPDAIRALEKALQINPTYNDAILKLGILYCQQRQLRLALGMLERARELDPSDQDLTTLVEAGRNIIATYGHSSADLFPLFASYIGNSDHIDELIRGFVSHLNISPNLKDIIDIVEKSDFNRNNLDALLLLFQDYRTQFPKYSDIHYTLGIIYKKLNQHKEAEACFNESVRLNPNYIKARLILFNLLTEQNRFHEAIEHGYALERFDLLYPDLYCGLAETCLALAKYAEAEAFARKAVTINPIYPRAHRLLKKLTDINSVAVEDSPA